MKINWRKFIGPIPASKKYKYTKLPAANLKKHKPLPTKLTFVTKSKTFKVNPKHTRLHADPIAKREIASSIARRTEARSHIALTKKVESGFLRTAYHKKLGQLPKLFKQRKRALARAVTLSKKRGMRSLEKTSKKLDVNIKKFGVQEPGSRFTDKQWLSTSEAKALGFPPKEISSDMKAFYAKQKPLAKARRIRSGLGTKADPRNPTILHNIYKQPKSWKKRSGLIKYYKGVAKTELQQAKMDRQIFRDTTVQKLTGTRTFYRKGGKKVTKDIKKTIWSPELEQDKHTKRWIRTRFPDKK
jgi:hypothetical protein